MHSLARHCAPDKSMHNVFFGLHMQHVHPQATEKKEALMQTLHIGHCIDGVHAHSWGPEVMIMIVALYAVRFMASKKSFKLSVAILVWGL